MSQGQNKHIICPQKLVEMFENIGWNYAILVFRNLITTGTRNSTNWLAASFLLFAIVVLPAHATIGVTNQMLIGNPSNATSDTNNHNHYLIQRTVEAIDYSDNLREPNWASWDLTAGDVGSSGRSSNFYQDSSLPAGFYQVKPTDYSGSGYDRGHMCPSADRTDNTTDNDMVFLMSNIIPQSPDNNQGVWNNLENDCRTIAQTGNELLITCGPSGFGTNRINTLGLVYIASNTWKIVVVVTNGAGTVLSRINTSTRVIAVKIPNIAGIRSAPWTSTIVWSVPKSVSRVRTSEPANNASVNHPASKRPVGKKI